MKSPWRFLADLTSRRKAQSPPLPLAAPDKLAEEQASNQDVAPKPAAMTTESTDHSLGPTDIADAASPVRSPSVVSTAVEPSEAAFHSPSERTANIAEPEFVVERQNPTPLSTTPADLGGVVALPTPRKSRSKHIKPASIDGVTQSPVKSIDDLPAAPHPAKQLTFLEEVAVLDEEVAALKAALALKLKLQNAQLRKMLERFDIR